MRYSKFETRKQQSYIGDSNNNRKREQVTSEIQTTTEKREQVASEIRTTTEGGRAVEE